MVVIKIHCELENQAVQAKLYLLYFENGLFE